MQRILIVGASLAGLRAAEALREGGFEGDLVMVGDEAHRPYDRPPLSKQCLAGRLPVEHTVLAQRHRVQATWRLGVPAVRLAVADQRVHLADGEALEYDRLLIATGVRARPWPDPAVMALEGVCLLRTWDDTQNLLQRLSLNPRRVVVVGGGFTGCEVASSCRERHLPVSLVLRQRAPLMASLSRAVGGVVGDLLRRQGVDVHTQTGLAGVHTDAAGKVREVSLTDGAVVEADIVVLALGSLANTDWLSGSGVQADSSGLVCDAFCRVLGPDGIPIEHIFAAGDVCTFPHPVAQGALVRVRHWGNAVAQARTAALNLLRGVDPMRPYKTLPAFWTHLNGVNIKGAGLPHLADSVALVQGRTEDFRFVAVYGCQGRTVGAVSFDSARWLSFYAHLVETGAPLPLHLAGVDSPKPIKAVPARFVAAVPGEVKA